MVGRPDREAWKTFILDLLFPRRCGLCGMLDDAAICAQCQSELIASDGRVDIGGGELNYRTSAYRYAGMGGEAVRRLKYERATNLTEPMGETIFRLVQGMAYDAAVPVPIHISRRAFRGFNQAELLAEGLPRVQAGWLRRVRRTQPQAQMTVEARRSNLRGAFQASSQVAGQRILLVDDVYTSGATAKECALALKAEGAVEVGIVTYAVG